MVIEIQNKRGGLVKKYVTLLIPVIILALSLVIISGCGIAQSDYDDLLTQKEALENENNNLRNSYDTLQTDYDSAKSDLDSISAELETRTAEYYTLSTEYDALLTEKNTLEGDISDLQSQYDTAQTELDEIAALYPLEPFSSPSELEDWLENNDVSEQPLAETAGELMYKALDLQYYAMLDGYFISVDYDYIESDDAYAIFCTTIIDDVIWYWDPETDEVFLDSYFGRID